MKFCSGMLFVLLCLGTPARAESEEGGSAGVNKSAYTLFNPTPEEAMREFETDRPDRSDGPFTVDAGHLQYESSLVAYSRHRTIENGVDSTNHGTTVNDMELRLGILNNLDIEADISSFNWQSNSVDGVRSSSSGFGDITAYAKWNFLGNDQGPIALGLMGFVKVPTAAAGIGNGKVEGGLIFPVEVKLPHDFELGMSFELARLKNENDDRFHSDFNTAVSLEHPIGKRFSAYAEIYAGARGGDASGWESTFDLGVEYLVTENVQLDTGCNIGLTHLAADYATFLGLSFRL